MLMHVIYIPDGGPSQPGCDVPYEMPYGWEFCGDPSVGIFIVVNDDTNEQLGTVNFCQKHAEEYATGYFKNSG
jgi:hypothetical protein